MAVGDPFQNLPESWLQVFKGSLEHPPHVLGQVVGHKLQDKVNLTASQIDFFGDFSSAGHAFWNCVNIQELHNIGMLASPQCASFLCSAISMPAAYAFLARLLTLAKSRKGRNLPQGEAGKALLAGPFITSHHKE